jgi:hypothetical protein
LSTNSPYLQLSSVSVLQPIFELDEDFAELLLIKLDEDFAELLLDMTGSACPELVERDPPSPCFLLEDDFLFEDDEFLTLDDDFGWL